MRFGDASPVVAISLGGGDEGTLRSAGPLGGGVEGTLQPSLQRAIRVSGSMLFQILVWPEAWP